MNKPPNAFDNFRRTMSVVGSDTAHSIAKIFRRHTQRRSSSTLSADTGISETRVHVRHAKYDQSLSPSSKTRYRFLSRSTLQSHKSTFSDEAEMSFGEPKCSNDVIMGKNWSDIVEVAIQTEDQSNLILWRGAFTIESSGLVIHWNVNPRSIVVIRIEPTGKNTKTVIDYMDIINIVFDPSDVEVRPDTPPMSTEDSYNYWETLDKAKGTLMIAFTENKEKTSADVIFLPKFGYSPDYDELLTLWNEYHSLAKASSLGPLAEIDSPFLLHGSRFFNDENRRFAWILSRRALVICFSDTMSLKIPLSHICHLLFEPEEFTNSVCIKYLTLLPIVLFSNGNHGNSEANTITFIEDGKKVEMTVAEHSVTLFDFGSESSFAELGLLWRQEMQLRAIEVAFSGDEVSAESKLAAYVMDMCMGNLDNGLKRKDRTPTEQLVNVQSNGEEKTQSNRSLRRADSMRRIMSSPSVNRFHRSAAFAAISSPHTKYSDERESTEAAQSIRSSMPTLEIDTIHSSTKTSAHSPDPTSPSRMSDTASQTDEFRMDDLRDRNNAYNIQRQTIHGYNFAQRSPLSRSPNVVFRRHSIASPNGYAFSDTQERTSLVVDIACLKARTSSVDALGSRKRQSDRYWSALYDYEAQTDNELSFNARDMLDIQKKDGTGWWYAILLQKHDDDWIPKSEGWVPSNYLK